MTALALPKPKDARIPRARARWYHTRLAGSLLAIWGGELWPIPIAGGVAIFTGLGWWTRAVALLGLAIIANYWRRGRLSDNVTDTLAALVRWDWRLARLAQPTMPKLERVTVRKPHGPRKIRRLHKDHVRIGLPAAQLQLLLRPHQNDNVNADWLDRYEDYASRRYGYSASEIRPYEKDRHVLVLDLGEMVMPHLVTAFDED